MKTTKCKYCKTRFNQKEWHTEKEIGLCFTCRVNYDNINALAKVLESNYIGGKKSNEYWAGKINQILNEIE